MASLKNIAKSIKSMSSDINAEVVVADLAERGFDFEGIVARHSGLFKRNFSKDILDAYFDVLKNLLVIDVCRDSLYDILPYGLFHHMFSDFNVDRRKAEFEKMKKEEEFARKFFMPIDNEFFVQYVDLELDLRKNLRNPDRFFQQILLFGQNLPASEAVKLSTYILFADKIIGDPDLTALLLGDLIDAEVSHNVFYTNELLQSGNGSQPEPGDGILGVNLLCGEGTTEIRTQWEFSIWLEKESDIKNYLKAENNAMNKLIDLFFDYFIPFEIEVKTKVLSRQEEPLQLESVEQAEADYKTGKTPVNYLGFNTVI